MLLGDLDDLCCFISGVIGSLRAEQATSAPGKHGADCVSHAQGMVTYPANFIAGAQ